MKIHREPCVPLKDVYGTPGFPDVIRTWPDGTQQVLSRDGKSWSYVHAARPPAPANTPDFEATGVGRFSTDFPFRR